MKYWVTLLLVFSFVSISADEHPIYISMAEIDYKSKANRLEIAVRVYSDDLQKAISAKEGELIEIGTDREHPEAVAYIKEYLRTNFKLYNKGKPLEWEYVGRELKRQEFFAMWVYLKVDKLRKLKELKLYNNILIAYQERQENKISFRVDRGPYKKYNTYKGHQEVMLQP